MKRIEPFLALALAGAIIAAAIAAPWLRFVLTIALAKGIAVLGIMLLLRAGQVSFGHGCVCLLLNCLCLLLSLGSRLFRRDFAEHTRRGHAGGGVGGQCARQHRAPRQKEP